MPTLEELSGYLQQMQAEDARFGDLSQPLATSDSVAVLKQQAREKFNYELPSAYEALLALSDGVNFNGYTLYASKTRPIAGYSDRLIEGFVEANKLWEEYAQNADHHLLVFGETGDDLFLFDRRDQKFKVIDKVGGDAYEEFDSFEELAAQLFKNALGIFDNESA